MKSNTNLISLDTIEKILDKERLQHGTSPLTSINRIHKYLIESTMVKEDNHLTTDSQLLEQLKPACNNWEILKVDGNYWSDYYKIVSVNRKTELEGISGEKPTYNFEIFTLGDYISNGDYRTRAKGAKLRGHITHFEINKDREMLVYTDWSKYSTDLASIKKVLKDESYSLPSEFQIDEFVHVEFDDRQRLFGKVTKVSFVKSKILYDVEVEILLPAEEFTLEQETNGESNYKKNRIHYTRIHSVDSRYVYPPSKAKAG